jgi:hypothetical protein
MESTTEAKPKRQMTPEQLEKLKLAREKALQKKREIKGIKDGEKAMKQQEFEDRKKRVEEFAKLSSPKSEFKKSKPPAQVAQTDESSSESDEEIEHQIIVKKAPKKSKKNIFKKVIKVSSSSSDSESDDDAPLGWRRSHAEDYRERLKTKYKNKYKNKYASAPPSRDVLREQASDVIRNNVSKELRKIALSSVFPEY